MRIIAEEEGTSKEMGQGGLGGRLRGVLSRIPADAYLVALVVLASSGSFGLGYLSGREAGAKGELSIEQMSLSGAEFGTGVSINQPTPALTEGGQYVASKNGTKYHLPWCSGAKNISEANKIWFENKEEAEAKGYTAAANCPGI